MSYYYLFSFFKRFSFIFHDTPEKDLKSILEIFIKGSMPPFNSESKITDSDIKKVEEWVNSSLDQI